MRKKLVERKTLETEVVVELALDGNGYTKIQTGVGFFDHLLELFAFHGRFDLRVEAKGDLEVDDHHLVEDVGMTLGRAFKESLSDKKGITRYGYFVLPMDETLVRVVVDISGRPYLGYRVSFPGEKVGKLSTENIEEFFAGFVRESGMTLHIDLMEGKNSHHIAEAIFKCSGMAIKKAVTISSADIPSTKGNIGG